MQNRVQTTRAGTLGVRTFDAGRYVYTGSAKRNLEARVRRHLSCDKRLHWHIDYLLAAPGVRIVEVRRVTTAECALNRRTAGTLPVPGFGAGDCRERCGSHLKYCGRGSHQHDDRWPEQTDESGFPPARA